MRTTTMTDAEINQLIGRSYRLRMRSADSRWLLRRGARYVVVSGEANEERLHQYLETAIREEYNSAVVIWILLHIVLPVVIKLIIEWWLNRNTEV